MMSRQLGDQLFYPKGVPGLGIKLKNTLKQSSFIKEFSADATSQKILLSTNQGLRDRAVEVFDQTFQITWMLALIAGLIASLSLANYVSISLIERTKELIQLRSIGASKRALTVFIWTQAMIVTCLAILISLVITRGVLYLLVTTINKPIFGWTIQTVYSLTPIAWIFGLGAGIASMMVWILMRLNVHRFNDIRIGYDI